MGIDQCLRAWELIELADLLKEGTEDAFRVVATKDDGGGVAARVPRVPGFCVLDERYQKYMPRRSIIPPTLPPTDAPIIRGRLDFFDGPEMRERIE